MINVYLFVQKFLTKLFDTCTMIPDDKSTLKMITIDSRQYLLSHESVNYAVYRLITIIWYCSYVIK